MKMYQVLLVGVLSGLLMGYFWHFEATKTLIDRNNCSWDDINAQTVMLNGKIPAKIIEVEYDKIN